MKTFITALLTTGVILLAGCSTAAPEEPTAVVEIEAPVVDETTPVEAAPSEVCPEGLLEHVTGVIQQNQGPDYVAVSQNFTELTGEKLPADSLLSQVCFYVDGPNRASGFIVGGAIEAEQIQADLLANGWIGGGEVASGEPFDLFPIEGGMMFSLQVFNEPITMNGEQFPYLEDFYPYPRIEFTALGFDDLR
jgi:hypothetical protein